MKHCGCSYEVAEKSASASSKRIPGLHEKSADEGVIDLCLVSKNGPSEKLG